MAKASRIVAGLRSGHLHGVDRHAPHRGLHVRPHAVPVGCDRAERETVWHTFDVSMWQNRKAYIEFCDTTTQDLHDVGEPKGAGPEGYVALSRMDNFKTPGIRNIEARHSAAGGGDNHTPASASPMGRSDLTEGRHAASNSTGT